jgi:hypothetical protein
MKIERLRMNFEFEWHAVQGGASKLAIFEQARATWLGDALGPLSRGQLLLELARQFCNLIHQELSRETDTWTAEFSNSANLLDEHLSGQGPGRARSNRP